MRRPVSEFWPTFWAWLVPAVTVVAVPLEVYRLAAHTGMTAPAEPKVWDRPSAEAAFIGATPAEVVRKLGDDYRESFDGNTGNTTRLTYHGVKMRHNGVEFDGRLEINFGRGGRCTYINLIQSAGR